MKQTQVVIAGGGPIGMTLAHDLAARGIRCVLAERNPSTTSHPKMDITNARSMELFKRAGLDAELRAVAVPQSHGFDVSYVSRLVEAELHRFVYPSPDEARRIAREANDGAQPSEPAMRVSQVEIEPVLRRAIERNPLVEVRFGLAFEDFQQDAEGVTVTLRRSDNNEIEQVRCLYLVGCDGGRSRVRELASINLSGQSRIVARFMTHFRSNAPELQQWGPVWHYRSAYGALISQNARDIYTLHSPVNDGVDPATIDPKAVVANHVGRQIDMEVMVANIWSPHLLVADAYRHQRVLIAGDAAHQYIPTGGYGMNTGVGDAYDLGWKLSAVLQGWGGQGLLDSYEVERRSVGVRNCNASRRHIEVRLNINKQYTAAIHGSSVEAQQARIAVGAAIAKLGNAENESLGIEMGFRYLGSPILPEGPPEDAEFDPVRYKPRVEPGVRLPNVFLDQGVALHAMLGPWFTVIQLQQDSGRALMTAGTAMGIPIQSVSIPSEWKWLYKCSAILVRPDMFIAWCGEAPSTEAHAKEILRRATGWSPAHREPAKMPVLVTE